MCKVDHAWGNEILLPTGRCQIVLGLHPSRPAAVLYGPTTRSTMIDSSTQRLAAGVVVRPGGLAALTGDSASDFVDQQVSLADAVDLDTSGLIESLRAEVPGRATAEALGAVIERQLESVDRRPSLVIRRSAELLRAGLRVVDVCDRLSVSRSRLIAAFRAEVGVAPKLFSRLQRFEAAVADVRKAEADDLAAIAARRGYADQAHMSREFDELAGRSPGCLHRDCSPSPNHVSP